MPPPPQLAAGNINYGKERQMMESESEEEEDDEDNPFRDSNAAATPAAEKRGYTWREV